MILQQPGELSRNPVLRALERRRPRLSRRRFRWARVRTVLLAAIAARDRGLNRAQ